MKRLLIRTMKALGLLVVVLLLLLGFLVGTETGLRVALWPVQKFAPELLTVNSIDGRLLGPLNIAGLSLNTHAASVNVDSLALRWSPGKLLRRDISVQSLAIDGVQVKLSLTQPLQEDEPPAEPFSLPEKLGLPISAHISELSVNDISIITTPDAEVQRIEHTLLQLNYDRHSDALDATADIESPLLGAQLSITANAKDSYPIDGQINWVARLPDMAHIEGVTTINGGADRIQITQKLATPYELNASVTLSDLLESLSIEAIADVAVTSAAAIRPDLPAIGVVGNLRFAGQPQDGTLLSELTFSGDLPGTVNTSLEADISQSLLTLKELLVTVDEHSMALNANGNVDLSSDKPIADLSIQWDDVQWPLDGSVAKNLSGDFAIEGPLDDYTLTLNTTLDTPQLAGIVLQADGSGTQQSVNLSSLDLDAADGKLGGTVQVAWTPTLNFIVDMDGTNFNPGVFVADFPGQLNITIDAQGETVDETLQASLKALNIQGELRGQALQVNSVASLSGSDIALEQLTVNAGDSEITASGSISDQLDLAFSINSPDLSGLVPQANGSINAQGTISGSTTLPSMDVELAARSLGYENMSLRSLDLQASLDAKQNGPIAIDLTLQQGNAAGVSLESLLLNVDGRLDAHSINLTGRSDQGDIDLALSGALVDQSWRYTLQSSTLDHPTLDPWILSKPATGEISATTQTLNDACLSSASAEACVSASKSPQALNAQFSLSQFSLDTLQPFLPEGMILNGSVNSDGSASLPSQHALQAQFDIALDAVTLNIDNSDGESVRVLALQPSQLDGSIESDGATLNALLDLGNQGKLQANVKAAGAPDALMDATLSGRISGELSNLDVVEKLVPVLEEVRGEIDADFTLAGSVREPLLSGDLTLDDGNVSLVDPGIVISDATARISANNSSKLAVQLSARSNEGSINMDGTVDVASTPQPTVNLRLKGDQFQVLDTLEAEAILSPDLTIDFGDKGLVVNGEVDVPVLAITPKKIPAGVVAVSADQQVVGEKEPETPRADPVNIRADVDIVLGDDVFIDAFGLNAVLSGSLAVKEVPDQQTTASGQLEILDGTFKAYGQNLQIQKGQIIYAGGPIAKPGFDIEAVRMVTTELQVGIRARGALDSPQFSLFSDPPMSESEQMSYLVLGRPLQDNSPSENSAVRQAAMALGVAGGKLLTEKFGDKLGLDEIGIGSELRESGEQAALVVGKYLSPRLFVSYGIGLFEPVSTLKLDYTINRNIKLISETTESNSGGDIVFTFEGGK